MTPSEMLRLRTIKLGLELEMNGMRLTLAVPPCFTTIKKEFDIKVGRGPEAKKVAYQTFCEKFGFLALQEDEQKAKCGVKS